MQVSSCVYSTEENGRAIKDQICLSQSLMRVEIEIDPQPEGGQSGLSTPLTEFLCIISDFQKNVVLIYVSCQTPEQITDYFYFKVRSLYLHGSIYSR